MSKPALERAARALCHLDGHPEDAMMDGKPLWQDYLPEVRAVLDAIRAPDEAMTIAGEAHIESLPAHRPLTMRIWAAMVDAALVR